MVKNPFQLLKKPFVHLTNTYFWFSLTIATWINMSDDMKLIDVNGFSHKLTSFHVHMMMLTGWLSFILAWIMNILYYKIHPSEVIFDSKKFKEKLFIYIFGEKKVFFHQGMLKRMQFFSNKLKSLKVAK